MKNIMREVFQIEPGALNLAKGVRTAVGIFFPLYLTILQNVLATILGALVAALLITNVQSLLVLILIVLFDVVVGVTLKEVNYSLFVFFITNIVMLLLSLQTPGIPFIKLRIVETLVGAAIALVVIFVWEWMGPPPRATATLVPRDH